MTQTHVCIIIKLSKSGEVVVMPRTARKKDRNAIYHVMSRSISEFNFFPEDEDKSYFLEILKDCTEEFNCKVYAFCLMTTHYHIFLDTNGFDISTFMKSLNLRYVKYINKKYSRRGSLLAERFNSKIITSSEYALTVSAYIHNNPKDIKGYENKVFDYPYSSMGIYLGEQKDSRKLLDTKYILGIVSENESDSKEKAKKYAEMVETMRETGMNEKLRNFLEEFEKEQYEYKTYRTVLIRDKEPEAIISKIACKLGIEDTREIMHRWKRSSMRFLSLIHI